MRTEDTIAAISTPIGKGGIGIIRISGRDAFTIAENVLMGGKGISDAESHRLYNGYFISPESGEKLDEVMYVKMNAKNSYTREDMVEINTHGGVYLIKKLLETVLSQGARLAEAGEFTFRAFINGRIDLTQAEAVADLIESENEKSLKTAIRQVAGELKNSIKEIKEEIIDIYSNSEAEIEFAEEDIERENKDSVIKRLKKTFSNLKKMIESYQAGRYYKNGIKVGIFGRVNVGKSSLLNALIGKDRVIVNELPGTTRDVIEGETEQRGLVLKFFDTAGVREGKGSIENEGIKKTKLIMEDSDMAILVIDAADIKKDEDLEVYNELREKFSENKNVLIAYNKIDLIEKISDIEIVIKDKEIRNIFISAKEKIGIDKIIDVVIGNINSDKLLENNNILIVNVRHHELLKRANEGIERLIKGYTEKIPNEFLAIDFTETIENLGKITGDVSGDDLLNRIFSKFCIGK